MSVNKAKPNSEMYPGWDTWSCIKGCLHDCTYCYGKSMRGYDMTPGFREHYLNDNLGTGRNIFLSSMGDIGGDWVDPEHVKQVLAHCRDYDNLYLLQSKNPGNLVQYIPYLPERVVLGTTIETDRDTSVVSLEDVNLCLKKGLLGISKAPVPSLRMMAMVRLQECVWNFWDLMERDTEPQFMLSIEPILDFDGELIKWIQFLRPSYVSIGAVTKGHKLGEPAPEKILYLIKCLRDVTEVRLKANLKRLIPEHELYGEMPKAIEPAQGELRI